MPTGTPIVAVQLPQDFSEQALIGQFKFEANCAACHGVHASGKDGTAPPLVHIIYEPNHHGDESFQLAVARGVRQHHWPFGNMPPVQGITRDEVGSIITYVRELQRANGIN
ncbi:MAG: cytochrome c [Hyphomicrobiales bacterium]